MLIFKRMSKVVILTVQIPSSNYGHLSLLYHLTSTLFPIRDGDIFTGTFHDRDIMYDGVIDAFSRAIDRLGEEE